MIRVELERPKEKEVEEFHTGPPRADCKSTGPAWIYCAVLFLSGHQPPIPKSALLARLSPVLLMLLINYPPTTPCLLARLRTCEKLDEL